MVLGRLIKSLGLLLGLGGSTLAGCAPTSVPKTALWDLPVPIPVGWVLTQTGDGHGRNSPCSDEDLNDFFIHELWMHGMSVSDDNPRVDLLLIFSPPSDCLQQKALGTFTFRVIVDEGALPAAPFDRTFTGSAPPATRGTWRQREAVVAAVNEAFADDHFIAAIRESYMHPPSYNRLPNIPPLPAP